MVDFCKALCRVREQMPLVQCITNVVTVNDCANIILASGGSPSMSQDLREVGESVCTASALVCNLGAIELEESMVLAGRKANSLGTPVVLDPVAAGGTALRRGVAARLLREVRFAVIRGNASEIRSLAGQQSTGSGVDVSLADAVTEQNITDTVQTAKALANKLGSVIVISGVTDIVTDGERTLLIRNGCATMARITGSGCMLTSLIGAFCGAMPESPLTAAAAATAIMGIAGELAERKRTETCGGNASFRTYLIDAVFTMSENEIKEKLNYEVYEG